MPIRAFLEPTPIRSHCFLSLLLLSLSGGIAFSTAVGQTASQKPVDYVIFKNGDKLTGTLEHGVGDSLIFKSDVVGEVTITMDKVKELHSEESFVILKRNEKIIFTTRQPGNMTFNDSTITVADVQGTPQTVATNDLAYIIGKATYTQEVTDKPGFFHRWNGSITGGATVLNSTSYGQTFTVGVNFARTIPIVPYLPPRTRTSFNLLETYGKLTQPTIPQTVPPTPAATARTNIFHTDFEHDKYIRDGFYMLGNLSYDHNYAQGLDLQQIYGFGAGYTAIKDEVQELDFKGDIHYERQNFIQYPPPAISSPNQDLIGSTFGEAYRRALPAKIALTQSATYIQSWNNLHAYSAIAALGLALPVYHRFSLSVNLLDNYLNNPAFGYQKNSLQFVTGVTYTLH